MNQIIHFRAHAKFKCPPGPFAAAGLRWPQSAQFICPSSDRVCVRDAGIIILHASILDLHWGPFRRKQGQTNASSSGQLLLPGAYPPAEEKLPAFSREKLQIRLTGKIKMSVFSGCIGPGRAPLHTPDGSRRAPPARFMENPVCRQTAKSADASLALCAPVCGADF